MEYKSYYAIHEWESIKQLEVLLNLMVNDGWRVDSHKLGSNDNGQTGWTIFSKATKLKVGLLDCKMPVSQLYTLINQSYKFKTIDEFITHLDKGIKEICKPQQQEQEF